MPHLPARCLILSDPRLGGHLRDPQPLRPLIGGVETLAICGPLLRSQEGRERSDALRFMRRLQDICDREGTRLVLTGDAADSPLAAHRVITLAQGQVAIIAAGIIDPAEKAEDHSDAPQEDRVCEWGRLLDLLERPGQAALRTRLTACGLLDESGRDRDSARRIAAAVHAWRSLPDRLRRTAQRLAPEASIILTGIGTHPLTIDGAQPPIINLAAGRAHPLGLAGMIDGPHVRVVGIQHSAADAISIGRAPISVLPISTTTAPVAVPAAPAG